MQRQAFLRLAAATALTAAAPATASARPLAAARPLALATADDDSSVVALDLATGAVRRRIATIAGPSSIETVGGGSVALVGHADAGAISLIEVATLRVRHELGGFGEPRYAAASPDGRYAYVTDAGRGELIVIDVQAGRAVERVEAGALARHVTISPDGRTVYAALGPKAEAISVLDVTAPRRPRLVRTFAPVDRAHDVVVSADGRSLWVSSGTTSQVAIHEIRTLAPIARLSAGAPPQHVAMDGARVFVASGADGRMRTFRADGHLLRTTRIPLDSYNVTFGSGRVVTPSLMLGTVTTLDGAGRFIRRERVTSASHDACVVRSGA
jgi:DNA-binding beta-propeller fold protein YncE